MTSLHRVRQCGRAARSADGVGVRVGDHGAGFSNLVTCGSPWVDPVCNSKIMTRRALDLGLITAGHLAAGGTCLLGTLTIRHHAGQGLPQLWDAVLTLWRKITQGAAWKRAAARVGLVGYVRVVEVTWGRNGWHVHLHVLWLVAGPASPEQVEDFRASLVTRWLSVAVREGVDALDRGQDLRVIANPGEACQYLTKTDDPVSVGLEMTQTQSKTARTALSTVPVWETLSEIEHLGLAEALDRWHHWERHSKGRRQMTTSRGLRARFGLGVEATDEEIASADVGDDDLLLITSAGWSVVLEDAARHQPAILAAAETSPAALRAYLDGAHIAHRPPGEPHEPS